jgi:hypothetical protein
MSKPGLMFDVGHAQQPGRLLEEVTLLIGVLGAAHEADRVGAIDRHLSLATFVRDEPWGVLEPIPRSAIDGQVSVANMEIPLTQSAPRLTMWS